VQVKVAAIALAIAVLAFSGPAGAVTATRQEMAAAGRWVRQRFGPEAGAAGLAVRIEPRPGSAIFTYKRG